MKYDVAFADALDVVLDEYLDEESVHERGLFEVAELRSLRSRKPNQPYRGETAMRLWTALLTEIWARLFLDDKGKIPADISMYTVEEAR